MKKHQPALLGGLFIGVISSLPFINFLNCCCLWVILGGMLTAYLQQQNQPEPIEAAGTAFTGLLAGALGGMIYAAASYLMTMLWVGPAGNEIMNQVFDSMRDVPPETVEMIRSLTERGGLTVIAFVVTVPVFAVFGMLGALLGVAIFKKKAGPLTGSPA